MTIATRVGIGGLPPTLAVGGAAIGVRVAIAGLATGGGGGGGTDPTPVDPLPVDLSSPADQAFVPSAYPQFMVAVTSGEVEAHYTMIIQYSASADMSSPSTLTADFTTVDGGVVVVPASPVPATTYWRARVAQGATWRSAWTASQSFTVGLSATTATLPITWNIDYALDRNVHLWHLVPPVADVGDTITAYGQGFPDPGQGKIVFDGITCPVTRWVRFVPSDQADGDDRIIDGTVVDPGHYEVDFTAPDYDGPGGPLSVEYLG